MTNRIPCGIIKSQKQNYINTVQQDVCELLHINAVLANAIQEYSAIQDTAYGRYKWQIFYDMDLRNRFLKFMTPECFNQLKNVFLVSEIRTDFDGHLENYFLYKKPNDNKFTGIIPIDLEEMNIFNYCSGKKSEFNNFLYIPRVKNGNKPFFSEKNLFFANALIASYRIVLSISSLK